MRVDAADQGLTEWLPFGLRFGSAVDFDTRARPSF